MKLFYRQKMMLTMTVLSAFVTILSIMLLITKPAVIFERIDSVLGIVLGLIIVLTAFVTYVRIGFLENKLESEIYELRYQTKEIEESLIRSVKSTRPEVDTGSGFSHLQDSVEKFVRLYPYDRNVAYLASFSGPQSECHYKLIKDSLATRGYRLFRASDQQIAPDLFSNVIVLLLGCKYGIALFEPLIDSKDENRNVAFELGIMFSIGRKVLLLKDAHLPTLPTDIVGHLYNQYESPKQIPEIIEKWFPSITIREEKESSAPTIR